MHKLDVYFFSHLTNLTSLILRAPPEAPRGLEGLHHAPLALHKSHMPCLQTVFIEYIFIGPELSDFLVGHAFTLEAIYLRNCFSARSDGNAGGAIPWHQLFSAIIDSEPQKLSNFQITTDRPVPLFSDNGKAEVGEWIDKLANEDEDEIKRENAKLKSRMERGDARVWAYAFVDDKYGSLYFYQEDKYLSAREWRDQENFEELMIMVRRNAEG